MGEDGEIKKPVTEMRTTTIQSTETHAEYTTSQVPTFDTMQPVGQVLGDQQRQALPVPAMDPVEAEALQAVKPPDYVPMTQAEKDQCGKERKQKKAEAAKRADYEKKHGANARKYAEMKAQVEARIQKESSMNEFELDQVIRDREAKIETEATKAYRNTYEGKLEGLTGQFPPVEANPEAMMAALELGTTMKDKFDAIAACEREHWWDKKAFDDQTRGEIFMGKEAAQRYMAETYICDRMNTYMRTGKQGGDFMTKKFAGELEAGMKHTKLTTDRVVRRGVGRNALGFMMGRGGDDNALAVLREALARHEEVPMDEKGFCSTSTAMGKGYKCDTELIILAHKGTQGIDFSDDGSREAESELLINAGTRFRAISTEDVKVKDRDGTEKTVVRVYLETIVEETPAEKVSGYEACKLEARRRAFGLPSGDK